MAGPDNATDPANIVVSRETVRLSFIAILQILPPRQRAVLILLDVFRWSANEAAHAMGMTTAAVNSAVQRARSGIARSNLRSEELQGEMPRQINKCLLVIWKPSNSMILMHCWPYSARTAACRCRHLRCGFVAALICRLSTLLHAAIVWAPDCYRFGLTGIAPLLPSMYPPDRMDGWFRGAFIFQSWNWGRSLISIISLILSYLCDLDCRQIWTRGRIVP